MTTPDWADEEMRRLLEIVADNYVNASPVEFKVVMTDALRAAFLRGRVAGLREAAEIVARIEFSGSREATAAIRAAADKLEAGN